MRGGIGWLSTSQGLKGFAYTYELDEYIQMYSKVIYLPLCHADQELSDSSRL